MQLTRSLASSWPWLSAVPSSGQVTEHLPGLSAVAQAFHLPFDAARSHHAWAVQSGLLPRSILHSRDFERAIDALERFTLGPFARRV